MSSMYYSAAWTDSEFLLGCSHEHETIGKADSCIPCAGGYVVGVENGVMRSLTAEEEAEFQRVHYAPRSDKPPLDEIRAAPAEAAVSDSGYAVMTRIRVGDHWIWVTWMCFKTYAQAAAHAREGNKVVRFRSSDWAALRQRTEAASPIVINALRESLPPRGDGETLLEFVLRFLNGELRGIIINTDKPEDSPPELSTLPRLPRQPVAKLPRQQTEDTASPPLLR